VIINIMKFAVRLLLANREKLLFSARSIKTSDLKSAIWHALFSAYFYVPSFDFIR